MHPTQSTQRNNRPTSFGAASRLTKSLVLGVDVVGHSVLDGCCLSRAATAGGHVAAQEQVPETLGFQRRRKQAGIIIIFI